MTHTDGMGNVETLINRFGGMRPMSRKIDVPVSTIQGWKKRDFIPAERVEEIVMAARAHHISLDGIVRQPATNENTKPESVVLTATRSPETTVSPVAPSISPVRPRLDQQQRPRRKSERSQPQTITIKQIKRDVMKRSIMTTVCVLAVLGGIGFFLFGEDAVDLHTIVNDQQEMDRRVTKLRGDYDSLETTVTSGLNNINSNISDIASSVGIERDSHGNVILNRNMTLSERVTAVESRLRASGEEIDLGQIVNRLENISAAVQGQDGDMNAAMADMKTIIDGLQSRIGDMDAALEQAKADNAELAKSLQGVSGRDISAAAMLLTLTQMRESLNRSEPFADDLKILQNLVGDDDPELTAAINRLAPYAESGVLTPDGLSSELRSLTGDIISASLRGEDVSVKEKLAARLGQILSVEKNGKPIMGNKEQAIIARAQTALDQGDVATAVNELNKLQGDAATAASPITNQAIGTLNAQNTVDMLMQNLVQKLQNPDQIKSMMQSLPNEIKNQMQGTKPIILTQ